MAKRALTGTIAAPKVIARALRDAGMEVIYTGSGRRRKDRLRPPPGGCRRIGLSILSGAHNSICRG